MSLGGPLLKPMLNGGACNAKAGRTEQQVDQDRGNDGASSSSSDTSSEGHAEISTSSSDYSSGDDDDGGNEGNLSNPDVNAPDSSSTSSDEDNESLASDPSPTSPDGPQLPTLDEEGTEETKADPPHLSPAQTRALRRLAPHTGDPPGTALSELRPGRTRGQTRRLLHNPSQRAHSIIKNPAAAHCSIEDFSRGLACLGADAGASRTALCNLSANGSQAPLGMVNEMGPEPTSYKQVRTSTHRTIWEDAMARDLQGLKVAKTFTPSDKPPGRKARLSRWTFKWKSNPFGEVAKAKATLVARGFSQTEGVDYFQKFSPTPAASTIRLIAAAALENDLDLFHFNAEQAFV